MKSFEIHLRFGPFSLSFPMFAFVVVVLIYLFVIILFTSVLNILFRLCSGQDCKRCSHPPSLGTPVHDVPSGVWHCLWCLKKKIESGVHSVTQGVESIWDAREVDVSGVKDLID